MNVTRMNTDTSVHWACAGLEDGSIPSDEWECPDCRVKISLGGFPA